MKIAFVGCGYVFDTYMRTLQGHPELVVAGVFDIDGARARIVGEHYGLFVYPDYAALLADTTVGLIVNLTSISSHYAVTKAALEAGKHVYSEKPLTTRLDEARDLFATAAAHGVVLSGAPCNLLSDSVQTIWKAIRDGAIGAPLLVYAELDDNPIYLMKPETWRSSTGAPWPYISEYQEGCTFEPDGYHLVWMCAMFGPAVSVTAFSKSLVANKTTAPLRPDDTPDFSVGLIEFESGVAARVTCSIVAPADHRLRIIGDEGEISAESYRNFQSPVMLERFSSVGLNGRKARTVRLQPLIGALFGVGGQELRLVRNAKSGALHGGSRRLAPHKRVIDAIKRREVYAQDKMIGIAEMARAIAHGERQPIPADFLLHITELTLAISGAGPTGSRMTPTTRFEPIEPLGATLADTRDFKASYRPKLMERVLEPAMERLHKH